jgi:hypothetical protein
VRILFCFYGAFAYGKRYVHGAQKEICAQHPTLRNLAKQNKVGSVSTTTPFCKERKRAAQSRGLLTRFRQYFRWFDEVFWGRLGKGFSFCHVCSKFAKVPSHMSTSSNSKHHNCSTMTSRKKAPKFEERYKSNLATRPGQSDDNLDILGATVLSGMCVWS